MAIALNLKRERYPAEATNLYLDALNIPGTDVSGWRAVWEVVEKNALRFTPSTRRTALGSTGFSVRSAWRNVLGASVGGPEDVSPAVASTDAHHRYPESPVVYSSSSSDAADFDKEAQSGGSGQQPPEPTRTADGEKQPPDPPRNAYALLTCDEVVIAGREFALRVGLARNPDPTVAGDKELIRPASSVGPYQLRVQIVADTFDLKTGERWRNEMVVTVEDPYPAFAIHLTPVPQPENTLWSGNIQAIYSIDGQVIGVAFRSVAIIKAKEFVADASPSVQDSGAVLPVPSDESAPDLTITITFGDSLGRAAMRQRAQQRMRLTAAAQLWETHMRDPGGLLGGSLLAEAENYTDLDDLEKEFIDCSRRAARTKARLRLGVIVALAVLNIVLLLTLWYGYR